MRLIVQQFQLQNPTWQGNAWPGQNLTASVTAAGITNDERIEFVIQDNATNERVDSVMAAAGQTSVQWPVPNLPSTANVSFRAILREAPSPANGQLATIMSVTSPVQALQSFGVQINNVDAAFVPGPAREQLQLSFTVTDANNRATQGRYEIWGERYPGATPEPLYRENFVPAAGAMNWNTWRGLANKGHLNGKYITPEFSPYRVRIIIGTSAGDVDDPYGVGLGKVACAESPFEVKFKTIGIKKWQNLQEATTEAEYRLDKTLMVMPPRNADGTYAAVAELPEDRPLAVPAIAQTARIRVPIARHQAKKDELDQGSLAIGGSYMEKGDTKWKMEEPLYSRPELPIQFEPKLASRVPGANPEGIFEPQAVGPAVIEPVAEEFYNTALLDGAGVNPTYCRNAAFKVKKGKHDAPYHDANNQPEFHYWQARIEVSNADVTGNVRTYDVTTFDNALKYLAGQDEFKELYVYLNRRLLSRSDRNDDQELDKHYYDYREIPNGPNSVQIRLRPNFTHVDDVLWIVRTDSTASGDNKVKNWEVFPPGPNCHKYYGGVRGEEPTSDLSNYFRANFSKKGKKKPIIGKANAAFPFNKYIDLKPDLTKPKERQERVETGVMLSGNELGRAGVIFSPSCIGGDAYVVHAWIEREGYARRFGFIEEEAAIKSKSGTMTVWRWARIKNSYRLPNINTNGLAATVGGDAETPMPGRGYAGNGVNMPIDGAANSINTFFGDNKAFNEWTLTAPPAGGGGDPVHQHVDLNAYRTKHASVTSSWTGYVSMANNGAIKNYCAVWDAYRMRLPPGLPNLPNLIANTIAAQAVGTSTHDVGVAVENAITGHGANPDVALNGGVAVIPNYPSNDPDDYENWLDGRWDTEYNGVLDALVPAESKPEKVNVLRWPFLHEHEAWIGYDDPNDTAVYSGSMTNGFSSGDAQSMFRTADLVGGVRQAADTGTFPHEMGHAMNLIHFVAGNFGWKHHDVNSPDCLMSYTYCGAIIPRASCSAPVAAGVTREDGWPDNIPSPIPSNTKVGPGAVAAAACIYFQKLQTLGQQRNGPCAKCQLKVRGWKDELLPFAWKHPDLF